MKRCNYFSPIGRFFPIFTAGAIALIASCTLFDLSAPTWDTHFTVPLINKNYTMGEFIEDEDDLVINEDGLVAYTLTGEIKPFQVGKHLRSDRLESPLFFYVDENYTSSTKKGAVKLSEQYQIVEAVIQEGSLYIDTINPTRYEVDTWYNLQDILHYNIPGIRVHPDGNQTNGPFDLAGVVVTTDPQDRRSIRYEITAQKVGEGPSGANSGDIEIVIRIEDLVFEQVDGVLNQVGVPLDTTETNLNLPKQLEGIEFGPLTLQLMIDNGADVLAEADIRFEAINKDGEKETLFGGGTVEGNAVSTLGIDGFEKIINHFPERLYFFGTLLLGDGQTRSFVRYDDIIQGSYFSEIPLVFNIDTPYINETEPDTIELSEDAQDAFRDNMLEADLMLEVFNHLPIGATIDIIFSRKQETVYTQSADVVKTLRLNPGETPQGQDGTTENPLPLVGTGESLIQFGLTKEEFKVFERDQVFFGTRISFDATPGFVQVSPEDYIFLRSWIDATLHMQVPEEEGGES